jgi:hypothetical protein
MDSKPCLFLITRVEPITWRICFLRKSASKRVTVSRDDPIICAISSCVSVSLMRTWPFSPGYFEAHSSRKRASFLEDSPTCINFIFNEKEARRPGTECPLIDFVPAASREKQYPCRHIHLTECRETVNSFYEWGTEEELETALAGSLKRTIEHLEAEDQTHSSAAD